MSHLKMDTYDRKTFAEGRLIQSKFFIEIASCRSEYNSLYTQRCIHFHGI